ncbi:SusC/RagA family TonB-linked outer membrane protein [Bacteroides graminisolvens]|uniref:SusC/RagA family TonB-linked outer membrane protein n=1 Tax=Bacteroides graminisolvens TaxID=477666 RepID=UPI0024096C01|nr:SusC/RagA family TonB-linked outer membrane protein [Bacteroides graminisolvens]
MMKKRFIVFSFSLLFAFQALTMAQTKKEKTISLSFKNEQLSSAFKKIEKASGCKILFVYDDAKAYTTTCTVNTTSALAATKQVIGDHPFSCTVKGEFISITLQKKVGNQPVDQERTVSGTVVDENKQPLVGVAISVPKGNIGTVTDLDGNFTLSIPTGTSTLIVSYIGMKTQMVSADKKVLKIIMNEDVNQLSDVVVTAIGKTVSMDKSGITASVVASDKIKNSGTSTMLNALSGKASSVRIASPNGDPGSGSSIIVRGANTFFGESQPLVIIDGIPMSNSYSIGSESNNVTQQSRMNDIDPNDIESLQILKGASAAAVWGSRAANGVIVITTKNGSRDKKPQISYSYTKSFDRISVKHPIQSAYGQGTGGKYSSSTNLSWGDKIADRSNEADVYTTTSGYFIAESGNIYYPISKKNSTETYVDSNFDAVFHTGTFDQHDFSISGGNDKTTYFFSYGSMKQDGIVRNSTYNKQNIRLNATYRFNDWLKMSSKVSYVYTKSNRIQTNGETTTSVLIGLLRNPADFDIRDYKGTYVNASGVSYPNRQRMYRNVIGANEKPTYSNPLWVINEVTSVSKVNRFIYAPEMQIDPLSWLNITLRGGLDYYTDNRDILYPTGTSYYNGRYTQDLFDNKELNFDAIARATRRISKIASITGTMGYNINDKELLYNNNVITPFQVASNIPSTSLVSGNDYSSWDKTITRKRSNRFYTLADLELYDQVYVSATGMWESASTIAKTYFYPSANIAWQFNKALGTQGILSFGKLRASWGRVGTQPEAYKNETLATTVNSDFGGSYAVSSEQGNEGLKPEIKTEWEVGTDLRFFNDRANLKLTYYSNEIKDLLFNATLNSSTGYSTKYTNAGKMTNHGLEVDFAYKVVQSKDWNVDLSLNFNNNKNKVTELGGTGIVELGGSSYAVEGYAMGVLYRTGSLRDDDGNLTLNSLGFPQIDTSGSKYLGNPNPDWRGGLSLDISYKNFDLGLQLEHSHGGVFLNRTLMTLYGFGTHADTAHEVTLTKDLYNYAGTLYRAGSTVRGNINDFGGGSVLLDESWYNGIGGGLGTNKVNDLYVTDNTWTKIRNISLAYTFKGALFTKKTKLTSARISVIGRDLFTWSNQVGIDPESNYYGVSNAQGMDYFSSPTSKSVLFNIQITY